MRNGKPTNHPAPHAPTELRPGSRVEVRNRFDGSWAHGFEVAECLDDGYRIRRFSDGSMLAAPLGRNEVRRERRRETWWV